MYSSEVVRSHSQQNPDTMTLNFTVNADFLGWPELYKHIVNHVYLYNHNEIIVAHLDTEEVSSTCKHRNIIMMYIIRELIIH